MIVDREALLKTLQVAAVGASKKLLIEQSNAFVFHDGKLITFNGEILTRCKSPLDIEGAVPAEDFQKQLAKFHKAEVEIFRKGEELRIKAGRAEAGMAFEAKVGLPYHDVPRPKEFKRLDPAFVGTLLQAARVCGRDETQPRTTEVHVTSKRVEASDNFRFFRSGLKTGFDEMLIPALSVDAIGALTFRKGSFEQGWAHFKTPNGHVVSVRCSKGEFPNLDSLLDLAEPRKLTFPSGLVDVISRAEVMHEAALDALVSVTIKDGQLTLRSEKEGAGWYRESKKIKYKGKPLSFEVNPKFLEEVLAKTKRVLIAGDGSRLKIEAGKTVFCVSLEAPTKDEE